MATKARKQLVKPESDPWFEEVEAILSRLNSYGSGETKRDLQREAIRRAMPHGILLTESAVNRIIRQVNRLSPEFYQFEPTNGNLTTICHLRGNNAVVASGVAVKAPNEKSDDPLRAQLISYGRAIQSFTMKRV